MNIKVSDPNAEIEPVPGGGYRPSPDHGRQKVEDEAMFVCHPMGSLLALRRFDAASRTRYATIGRRRGHAALKLVAVAPAHGLLEDGELTALGLYRIRRAGRDDLDYIGQTGLRLRDRLAMLRGIYRDKMPYRDPHTVAPALWAAAAAWRQGV